MAPEVKLGRHYDTKADIYSLGVILGDLFDLNINIVRVKNSELEIKFLTLKELNKKMQSNEKEFRPNCDEILNVKKWVLSLNDIKDIIFEQIRSLDKESFQYFFISKKIYFIISLSCENRLSCNERQT
jgi:serine/threonine protein kinase